MTFPDILMIGIGLAMDAVAVSMTNGMVYRNLSRKQFFLIPLFFGTFQGLMPLAGYFASQLFASVISKYAGIVILLVLGIIGIKMIKEGFSHNSHKKSKGDAAQKLTFVVLFFQAIATSIDAFAVGIGFSAMQVNILPAVATIAVTTVVLTTIAVLVGQKSGDILGSKAEILGGIVLVIIGIKAVL